MSEHSPGPWEAHYEDGEPYISPNICRNINTSNPNFKANAQLIAAAPELLAAAKAVIEYKQQRGYMGAGFEDLVWLASEVVAKVEGKAQKGES